MSFGKTMYQMLIAGSQAYAKWDLEVSTSILKNHKKMLFLLALAVPILIVCCAEAYDAHEMLGGKSAYAPAFYTTTIFRASIAVGLAAGLITGCIGALALILTGVISEKDALKSIALKTIFLFGGTLSLASALDQTGAGAEIANIVIGALGENPSPYVLTLVVFLLCCVMTNFMSNTATTALMVPICLSIAQGMGADPRAVLMACVIGGSCAYATPIGMPANTMVVSAGGYTFKDYAKAGLPLILIATVVSMVILPIAFPFFPQ